MGDDTTNYREALERKPAEVDPRHAANLAARRRAKELASERIAAGDPAGWFEPFYAEAGGDPNRIPWADLDVKPFVREALDLVQSPGRALVVGCGLGDDAEECARRGWDVVAFDISPSAIAWAKQRFPSTRVDYQVADLFAAPAAWAQAFDLVLEVYTLQALPVPARRRGSADLLGFVRAGGAMVVVARGREDDEPEGDQPWPLTRSEMAAFAEPPFEQVAFREVVDDEDPPVRRFVGVFRRMG